MLTFLAHLLVYLIMGIVIAQKSLPYINRSAIFYIITVYLSLNLVRALVLLSLSPFLSRLGYGFNWRWGAIIVWSGMRGTFTLNMALGISQTGGVTPMELQIKNLVKMNHSFGKYYINMCLVCSKTCLCNITLPKRMAMHNALQRIGQMEANTFAMLKLDRFLADANWKMAEETIKIDYPYKVSMTIDIFKIEYEIHYQKQYNCGMLNQDAAQTLIGAAESYVDIEGKNKFLRLCHQIVFMEEFEYISCMITYLNSPPIILQFIPSISVDFFHQLKLCNYYFLCLYVIEATLKILAMGRTYIHHHWNKFDLMVIILGIADVLITNLTKSFGPSYSAIKIFRIFRLLRIMRLIKLSMPKIIFLLDKQINKQLTFRYDIAKGYVQGEEDIKCLIQQIAGHEKVYQEINKILEKNKQEAMKELGLMQRDYPDIVTAVKTKQAVQTVLNTASETLKFMISGGIVDKTEGDELQKFLYMIFFFFFQKKAKVLYFDYGDIICQEGDLPRGIYLIVSGVVKVSCSTPSYGAYLEDANEVQRPVTVPYTDYFVAGAIIGELNCLTKQEMEYGVTCETAVQTCFISIDDLLEAFDKFLEPPSLEYKIWLKLALDIALKTFKENLPSQVGVDEYLLCVIAYISIFLDSSSFCSECDIYDGNMDDVILVYGAVLDCQLGDRYRAPCILPKTCHQVRRIPIIGP
uniref:Cyclic nucleotide-binding domain-containing protein n=1 Tax=Salvator merianae TaxID=96440 RepID=A0A8D0DNL7_SALMN